MLLNQCTIPLSHSCLKLLQQRSIYIQCGDKINPRDLHVTKHVTCTWIPKELDFIVLKGKSRKAIPPS